jgi:hypothetical protein
MKINFNLKYLLFLITVIWIASCANPQPPSGGPQDTTPPEITDFEPKNRTLKFNQKKITIEFNKYMDKNKVTENVFISPLKKINFDWSGKTLNVEFDEELDTNTTYNFTLGTEYADLKGNKPKEAFTIVFSTGSNLDSGKIQGIIDEEKPEGTFIIAYRIDDINPDTLNINKTDPKYRTQAGTSGKFEFQALKDGKYRLFVFKEKEKNGQYDEGSDNFGSFIRDLVVKNGIADPIVIKIGNAIDKVKPSLFSADGVYENHVLLSFSEPIDTFSIKNESFILMDSLGKELQKAKASFMHKKFSSQVIVQFDKILKDIKYKIKCQTNSLSVRDTAGNTLEDTLSTTSFYGSGDSDTLKPQLMRINLRDSIQKVILMPDLRISFNTSIDTSDISKRIKLFDNRNMPLPIEIMMINSNYFKISPVLKLNNDEWYRLALDLSKMKSNNGLSIAKDTLIKYAFKTEDTRANAMVSGKIKDNSSYSGSYVVEIVSKENRNKFTIITKNKEFVFESIPAGTYYLWSYADSDNNEKYTAGNSFPFNYSERFSLKKDINVKSRWNLENLIIDF